METPEPVTPAVPLTREEIAHYRALAEKGETPSLDIVRRFVATIRKTFNSTPKAVEKSKVSRNTKPKLTEDQLDFF